MILKAFGAWQVCPVSAIAGLNHERVVAGVACTVVTDELIIQAITGAAPGYLRDNKRTARGLLCIPRN